MFGVCRCLLWFNKYPIFPSYLQDVVHVLFAILQRKIEKGELWRHKNRGPQSYGKIFLRSLTLILRYQSSWSSGIESGPSGAAMAGPLLNILADQGHTQQLIACMYAREPPKLTTISQVRRHQKENTRLANIPLIINLCDHINPQKIIHNIATCVALASAHPVDVQTSSLV